MLPDQVVEDDSRFHNLTAVAHALANNGLRVTFGPASMFTERIGHDDALTMFSVRSVPLLHTDLSGACIMGACLLNTG